MEKTTHQFNEIDVRAVLLIKKRIIDNIDMAQYVNEISSYINHIEHLYIYNMVNQDLSEFYQRLSKYKNISYAECEDYGEVMNYQIAYEQLIESNADFGMVIEQGYYFEESAFLDLRRHVIEHSSDNIAVITAMPLRGCETFSRSVEDYRPCMGCKLVGALVNLKIFKEIGSLKIDYYQSMFDYEYCLRVRSKGYNVIVMNNSVLRNCNYKIIEKRVFFTKLLTFDYDLMDLYYQTRNRYYLWDEYEKIDPKYVALDKKLFKNEKHEMKMRDPHYRDKFYILEEAKLDYIRKIKGKHPGGN